MADPALTLARDAAQSRRTPWSEEAELSVLGAMLISGDAVPVVFELLDETAFFREGHRRIFRAMARLYDRGAVIDATTLSDELESAGELEAVGGLLYLGKLVDAVPGPLHVRYHCEILREKAILRSLITSATEIIEEVYVTPAGEVDETLDRAEQKIFEIAHADARGSFVRIKELMRPAMDRIEKLIGTKGAITGVASGFPDLDKLTSGFQAADLVVLAGRPSMGKTALALNIAQHAAMVDGIPVAIFSLEMSRDLLVLRMLCAESKVDSSRVRTGRISDDDYARLARGAGLLNGAPIWIDDTPGLTPLELRAKVRRLIAEQSIGLVVLDYLQLMSSGGRGAENRQQEISAISRSLKGIAREVGVSMMAISQLSRAPDKRDDSRPRLSDLRDSGAIEQDADVVLFIYRPEMYKTPEEIEKKGIEGKAELIIGKQRNGPTGRIDLRFHKAFTAFESLSDRQEPPESW